jgi:hypothetical protein
MERRVSTTRLSEGVVVVLAVFSVHAFGVRENVISNERSVAF